MKTLEIKHGMSNEFTRVTSRRNGIEREYVINKGYSTLHRLETLLRYHPYHISLANWVITITIYSDKE